MTTAQPPFRADHVGSLLRPPARRVTGKLSLEKCIFGEDFRYLKSIAKRTPKLTIPSPSMIHYRGGRAAADRRYQSRVPERPGAAGTHDADRRRCRPAASGLHRPHQCSAAQKDSIKRRIDEAAKFVPLDQLCLSPQCGFSSTVDGTALSVDQEVAKLRFIVEIAREVWG